MRGYPIFVGLGVGAGVAFHFHTVNVKNDQDATSRCRIAISASISPERRWVARLAVGDYIAVQIPEKLQRVWDWEDWVYDPRAGLIVSRADPDALIPYNYVVFSVSRYEGE